MKFVFFAAAALVLLSSIPAATQSVPMKTLRVVSIPGRPLPLVVAQEQGFLGRRGLAVQITVSPTSKQLREAVADGSVDIAHAAVDNAVAIAETADAVIVMGGDESLNELMAQPDIKSMKELRGHTVIVDAPDTAFALQLRKLLLSAGLQAGGDYEIKPYGTTPHRLAAMRENKQFAASMLGPPASLVAQRDGFASLASVREMIGPYQSLGAFVRKQWAKDNSAVLVQYLAAYIEGDRWLRDPAHKAQAIALIAKEWKVPQVVAEETYALIRGGKWFQPDARFDLDAFTTVLKLRAELEGEWGGKAPNPGKYYDPTFYNAAISNLKK